MINPNEIHSIEILRVLELKKQKKLKTKKVIIYQSDPNHKPQPLYTIYPVKHLLSDACQFHIDVHILNGIKAHFIRYIPEADMDKFITDLQLHFERGRYLFKDNLHKLPNTKTKNLSYKQIKRILTFEKNASKFLNEQPMAIQTANPKHIETFIDCGKYFLEVFNKTENTRPQYAYSTFDEKTNGWLLSIIS